MMTTMNIAKNLHTLQKIIVHKYKPIEQCLYLGLDRGLISNGYKISSIRCSSNMSSNTTLTLTTMDRRSAGYKPSIWNLDFLQCLRADPIDPSDDYEKMHTLKCELKNVVTDEGLEPSMVIELIDEIQRLGLESHFSKEIDNALSKLAHNFSDLNLDLRSTALGFRLLRQAGIFISQDVFKRFMDVKGMNFLPSLCDDYVGVINLYEASFLSFEGEHVLDEAKTFAVEHLNTLRLQNQHKDTSIVDYVNHSLELPLRYRLPMLEARDYIEGNSRRRALLSNYHILFDLAKLDYNMKQSLFQEDLRDMAIWWKDIGLSEKLSFARNRLMECFFWGVGTTPTPHLNSCRKALTKVYSFITIIDDIYDVYGQLHELELFTSAIERWDIHAIDNLPDYMKLTYLALYNTVNDIGYEILKQKGQNCVPFLKKIWEDMCKAFLVEAKWCHNRETPTFDEYINNGWVSISGIVGLTHAFFFVNSDITQEALQFLEHNHDILRIPSMVFRLTNDLATSEAELERGETANAITCYAKQRGVTHQEARKHISKMIDESWKSLNKLQVINNSPFSKDFIDVAMNLACTSQCAYQHGDGHSSPELLKNKIISLIVEPIH